MSFQINVPSTVLSLAMSPCQRFLVAGCRDGKARVYESSSQIFLGNLEGFDKHVNSLAFRDDVPFIMIMAGSGKLVSASPLFAVDEKIGTVQYNSMPFFAEDSVAPPVFAEDSVASPATSRIVQAATVQQKKNLELMSLVYLGNGQFICAARNGCIYKVKTSVAGTFEQSSPLYQHNNTCINSVAYNPVRKLIVSGGDDGSIKIVRFDTLKIIGEVFLRNQVRSVNFSHDGNLIVAGAFDGQVNVWDIQTLSLVCSVKLEGFSVNCVAFSPDDQFIAAGGREYILHIFKRDHEKIRSIQYKKINSINCPGIINAVFFMKNSEMEVFLVCGGNNSSKPREGFVQINPIYRRRSAPKSPMSPLPSAQSLLAAPSEAFSPASAPPNLAYSSLPSSAPLLNPPPSIPLYQREVSLGSVEQKEVVNFNVPIQNEYVPLLPSPSPSSRKCSCCCLFFKCRCC